MKTFAIDVALFLFGYVPLTYLLGVPGLFYLGEGLAPGYGYDFFLWFFIGLQVFIPSGIVLCVAYWPLKWSLRRASPRVTRAACIIVVPGCLILTQWLIWGGVVLSYQLLLAVILPAVLLGCLFRIGREEKGREVKGREAIE